MVGKQICIAALALGMVASLPARAAAYPITFYFSGVIDAVNDPEGVLDGIVRTGRSFSGSYTFDSTMADLRPSDPILGIYGPPGPLIFFNIDMLQVTVTADNSRIAVSNSQRWGDSYGPAAIVPFPLGELTVLEIGLTFHDTDGMAFAGDELPLQAPDLEVFETARLWAHGRRQGAQDFSIEGTVTTLTPEPGSLLLLVLGFALPARRKTTPL